MEQTLLATTPTDPFADEPTNQVVAPLLRSERDTTPPARQEPIQGQLTPYTRVADLSEDLALLNLEEFQGWDLLIFHYDIYHSTENDADFMTLEVAVASAPEQHFLVNCGGQNAMRKIKNAFDMVNQKKAILPLVAAFRKIQTSSGRSLWVVS